MNIFDKFFIQLFNWIWVIFFGIILIGIVLKYVGYYWTL